MTLSRNLFFVILLATLFAFMLSFLPDFSWQEKPPGIPVYQPEASIQDSTSVVDFLMDQNFNHRLKKVQVLDRSLRIDFIMDANAPEQEMVLTDLSKLVYHGFEEFPTLVDIWVRVLYRNQGNEELVIGLLVDRKQFDEKEIKWSWNEKERMDYLLEHAQISYGERWNNENNIPPSS